MLDLAFWNILAVRDGNCLGILVSEYLDVQIQAQIESPADEVAMLAVQSTREVASEEVLDVGKLEFSELILHRFHFDAINSQLGYLPFIECIQ